MPFIHIPSDNIIDNFQATFPYKFANRDLLKTALVVSEKLLPYFDKPTGHDADNLPLLIKFEELEFLGDKILEMLVGREVFKHHSGMGPGELSRQHTIFTRNAEADKSSTGSKLYRLARAWKVDQVIPAGVILTEERENGIPSKKNPLRKQNKYTDIAEALIGAVYQDCKESGRKEDETQSILWSQLIEPHYRQMGLYKEADEIRSYASSPSRKHRMSGEDLKKERAEMLKQISDNVKERNFDEIKNLLMGYPSAEGDRELLQLFINNYEISCVNNDWELAKAMIEFNPQEILTRKKSGGFFSKAAFLDFLPQQNRDAIFDLTTEYQEFIDTKDFIECAKSRFDIIFAENFEDFEREVGDLLKLSFHKKHQQQMDNLLLHVAETVEDSDRRGAVKDICKERFLETKNISLLRYLVLDAEKPDRTRTPLRIEVRKRAVEDMLPSNYDVSEISAENIDSTIASINDEISKKRETLAKFVPGLAVNKNLERHSAADGQRKGGSFASRLSETNKKGAENFRRDRNTDDSLKGGENNKYGQVSGGRW